MLERAVGLLFNVSGNHPKIPSSPSKAEQPSIRLPEVLPPEILVDILLRTDVASLVKSVALVDHSLRELVVDDYHLFSQKGKLHFPETFNAENEKQPNKLSLFQSAYKNKMHSMMVKVKEWHSLLKDGDLYRIKQLGLNISDILPSLTEYKRGSIFDWIRPRQYLRNFLFEEIWLHCFHKDQDRRVSSYYLEDFIGMLGPSKDTIKRLMPKFKRLTRLPTSHQHHPLFHAAKRHLFDTCDWLLERGAPIDWQDNNNESVLYNRARNGDAVAVDYLVRHGADKNLKYRNELTPLYIAAQSGHLDMVRILLELGVDPELRCLSGSTPMYIAAQEGHAEIIQLLYQYGATQSVNDLRFGDGFSPLYVACRNGHELAVNALLAIGADIEANDGDGSTPLYVAAQNGHHGIVRTLLSAGAIVDVAFLGGYTPLYVAAQNGHHEVVRTLIEFGAEVNRLSPNGSTALYLACQNGHTEVAKILIRAVASTRLTYSHGYSSLYVAAQKGHYDVVKTLLDVAMTEINQPTDRNATPLYVASQNNRARIVQLLLKRGADPWIQFQNGYTVLHIACSEGNLDVVKILIAAHPDLLEIKDHAGNKPVDLTNVPSVRRYLRDIMDDRQSPRPGC